jgi:hypothetical protein
MKKRSEEVMNTVSSLDALEDMGELTSPLAPEQQAE